MNGEVPMPVMSCYPHRETLLLHSEAARTPFPTPPSCPLSLGHHTGPRLSGVVHSRPYLIASLLLLLGPSSYFKTFTGPGKLEVFRGTFNLSPTSTGSTSTHTSNLSHATVLARRPAPSLATMGVTRKIVTRGNGTDRPKVGDEVTIDYTGNLYDESKGANADFRGKQCVAPHAVPTAKQ